MNEMIRKATWLELFYDLIFVVAIAKAVHVLGHVHDGHISPEYYLKYVLMMIPLWWAWTGHTLFANRYDMDNVSNRLLTFAQMFCAVSMAVFIDPDFEGTYKGFLFSYVAFRGLLVVMYWNVVTTTESDAIVTRYLGAGFTVGLLICLSSLLFDGIWKYVVIYAGIAFDMLVPLILRRHLKNAPVQSHHLPERFGLLTIILLGESVASLVLSLKSVSISSEIVTAALSGFVWIGTIWWIYYENLEHRIYGRSLGTGQAIIFLHLLIFIGLGGIANTIRFAIEPALSLIDYKLLAGMATLVFLIALELLHLIYHPKTERAQVIRNGAIVLALVLAVLLLSPTHLVTILAITAIFVAYTSADAVRRHSH
jgi:low temperature requirement protein LtrA